MLLQNKNAIIYGAAGSLGEAVSRAMAKDGAKVFLAGYKLEPVKKLADELIEAGGSAEADVVDALNEKEVNDYVNKVAGKAGTIDVCFNAISLKDLQGIALVEMNLDDFVRPVTIAMQTQFITSTAAGRVMMKQKSGVILSLTATPGGIGYANTGGFGVACAAIESFSTALASELGPYGVRVVNIRSAGSPDSRVFKEAIEKDGEKMQHFLKKWKMILC